MIKRNWEAYDKMQTQILGKLIKKGRKLNKKDRVKQLIKKDRKLNKKDRAETKELNQAHSVKIMKGTKDDIISKYWVKAQLVVCQTDSPNQALLIKANRVASVDKGDATNGGVTIDLPERPSPANRKRANPVAVQDLHGMSIAYQKLCKSEIGKSHWKPDRKSVLLGVFYGAFGFKENQVIFKVANINLEKVKRNILEFTLEWNKIKPTSPPQNFQNSTTTNIPTKAQQGYNCNKRQRFIYIGAHQRNNFKGISWVMRIKEDNKWLPNNITGSTPIKLVELEDANELVILFLEGTLTRILLDTTSTTRICRHNTFIFTDNLFTQI